MSKFLCCPILHLLVRVTIDSRLKKLFIEDWNISITKLLVHFRSYSYLAIFCRCLLALSIVIIPTNHMLFVVDGISQTSYRLMNIAHQILWMNRVSCLWTSWIWNVITNSLWSFSRNKKPKQRDRKQTPTAFTKLKHGKKQHKRKTSIYNSIDSHCFQTTFLIPI